MLRHAGRGLVDRHGSMAFTAGTKLSHWVPAASSSRIPPTAASRHDAASRVQSTTAQASLTACKLHAVDAVQLAQHVG